jgi:cytochrome c5
MKKTPVLLAAILLAGATSAAAGDTLPDPLAALQSGKKSFETSCSRCHKLDLPLSRKLDRAGWEGILGSMTARGASFEPAERALIVDYLVVKSTFETKCTTCHGAQSALASKRTREAWEATVKRMAGKNPPEFSAEEIRLITAYLTLVVGSE